MDVCSVSRHHSRPPSDETPMSNMRRLERLIAGLPEAIRVDIEEWGDHPTFRVRGKDFTQASRRRPSAGRPAPCLVTTRRHMAWIRSAIAREWRWHWL